MKLRILALIALTAPVTIVSFPAQAETADAGVYASVECGDARWRIRGYGSYEACYYAAAAYYDGFNNSAGGGVGDGPSGGGGGSGGGMTPPDVWGKFPGAGHGTCGSRLCTNQPTG